MSSLSVNGARDVRWVNLGVLISTTFLSIGAFVAATTLFAWRATVPIVQVSAGLLLLWLAMRDLVGRPPFLWRQTPQRWFYEIDQQQVRGLLWGVDVGLIFTTQRTTSLGLIALLGAIMSTSVVLPSVVVAVYGVAVCLGLLVEARNQPNRNWAPEGAVHGRSRRGGSSRGLKRTEGVRRRLLSLSFVSLYALSVLV